MPREYDLRLYSKYDISRHRYRELKEFCLQYEEKKSKLNQIYTLSSTPPEVPIMGGVPGKPTENKALKAQQYKADIELIEECLKETCGEEIGLIKYLKKNVTEENSGYYNLGCVPCSKNKFYLTHRKFFFLLDKRKSGDNGVILS